MLYSFLDFLRIKDKNKFLSILFYALSFCSIFYVLYRGVALLFSANGESLEAISPLIYAALLLLPVFAYSYGVNTKLISGKDAKIKAFIVCLSMFGLILSSYIISVVNDTIWWILKLLPNFNAVYSTYPELFAPALKTICFVIPFLGTLKVFDYVLMIYRDDDISKGISGFSGLKVAKKKTENKAFVFDNIICKEIETNEPVVVPEKKRMESTLVQGATGTGKTSMVLLPMCARDLEKKYFVREYSKKHAFELLKSGVAYLEGPYSNEYINLNFSLNMFKPKKGYEKSYLNDLADVVLYSNDETGEIVYKNIGVTIVENDGQFVDNFTKVASNFDIPVLTVDPINPNTKSMNPFAINDPAKVASIIADVLKSMQQSEGGKEEVFFAQVTSDAFQNLSILLKEMYPLLNNNALPSLEDVLDLLYNFDKVEEMVEDMKKIPELAEKYKLLIAYFEKNFYKPALNINGFEIPGTRGSGRKDTERYLYGAITQLNNLLRHPGIKKALCGRDNVIDFDTALSEGQVITACSRKGELGIIASKAFGMFFILQFQDAVLRRKGSEDTRIPHFLYIDEFPEYINKDTEVMFTLFRKYRCGSTIAIQNLSQLEKNPSLAYYRQVVLANTKTQIVFGDTTPEDSEYWNKAFGMTKKVDPTSTYDPSGGDFKTKKTLAFKDKERFKVHKIAEHKFGQIYFKTKAANGNTIFGEGVVSFLEDKYKEKHPGYMFNFEKYMMTKPADTEDNAKPLAHKDEEQLSSNKQTNYDPIAEPEDVAEQEVIEHTIKNYDNANDFDIVIDTGDNDEDDKK